MIRKGTPESPSKTSKSPKRPKLAVATMSSSPTSSSKGALAPTPVPNPKETKPKEKDEDEVESGFIFEEIRGDLFSGSPSESLTHCVSKDLVMGKGIAVLFKKKFGQIDVLKGQKKGIGEVAKLRSIETDEIGYTQFRYVYYMITKDRYYNKPTMDSMEQTLKSLRDQAVQDKVRVLSMPRIGCGLDGLKWPAVKDLIIKTFQDTSIKIKVYTI